MTRRKRPEDELESLELEFHHLASGRPIDKDFFNDPRTQRLLRAHEGLLPVGDRVVRKQRFPKHVTANDIIKGSKK